MNTFSFVISSEFVSETVNDLDDLELTIIENESDLDLGYFTVQGSEENIQIFKDFLNGLTFI